VIQRADSNDRRRHPRRQLRGGLSVELRVQVSGVTPAILLTRGMVADISCGGLKCDIDFEVPVGTNVDVCFPDLPGATPTPDLLDGRVIRTDSLGGVPEQVAIAFARPLEEFEINIIDSPRPMAAPRGRTAAARRASWADEPRPFPTFATGSLL